MSIPVSCSCGQQFMAQPHLAGKQLPCPSCGKPLAIPGPAAAAAGSAAASGAAVAANVVTCACGKSFKAPPHLAGKRVACPDCGQPIDVPAAVRGDALQTTTAAVRQPMEDSALGWDDALAAPDLNAAMGLPVGPAAVPRRPERDTIEPMTIYAIWAGIGAVTLLVLSILAHIIWNAFSGDGGGGPAPGQTVPGESAPADPAAPPSRPGATASRLAAPRADLLPADGQPDRAGEVLETALVAPVVL